MCRLSINGLLVILCAWCLTAPGRAEDKKEEKKKFEVHDVAVWIAEPNIAQINARDSYPNTLPGIVNSTRSREVNRAGEKPPAPLGLMMFYGEPQSPVDIDLRVPGGRFIAHWPPAEIKSGRLRWLDAALAVKPDEKGRLAQVPQAHWFTKARELGGLYLQRGARAEAFLAYDPEINRVGPMSVKLDGGPDKYTLTNLGKYALLDVLVCVPSPQGRRIAWLDEVAGAPGAKEETPPPTPEEKPAAAGQLQVTTAAPVAAAQVQVKVQVVAQPAAATLEVPQPVAEEKKEEPAAVAAPMGTTAEVALAEPLSPDDAKTAAQTTGALAERLLKTGLSEKEVALVVESYKSAIFQSESLVILYRLPPAMIDEKLPLVIDPEPSKTVRTVLVLARNLDPKIRENIQQLIADLGDRTYSKREAAEERLMELGKLATEALQAAQKNADPEVVFRVKRILLGQSEKIEGD